MIYSPIHQNVPPAPYHPQALPSSHTVQWVAVQPPQVPSLQVSQSLNLPALMYSVCYWNKVLKISNFIMLAVQAFLLYFSVRRCLDESHPITILIAVFIAVGILVLGLGLAVAWKSDASSAKCYLKLVGCNAGLWILPQLSLLAWITYESLTAPPYTHDEQDDHDFGESLVMAIVIFLITALILTLAVSSFFVFVAAKVYMSRTAVVKLMALNTPVSTNYIQGAQIVQGVPIV